MRTFSATLLVFAAVSVPLVALGQTPAAPQPASGKSLASTLNVYVFPGAGQSATQQSKDETECYNWAVKESGSDPFAAAKQAEQTKENASQQAQQAKQATQGSGARSAVKGAAAGAVIGEIADDEAGEGAAIGAAAGVAAGRRKARAAQAKADEQAKQTSQQATQTQANQVAAFNKGFSACLEAKKYTVKY